MILAKYYSLFMFKLIEISENTPPNYENHKSGTQKSLVGMTYV